MIAMLFSLAAATMGVQANAPETAAVNTTVAASAAAPASQATAKEKTYCIKEALTGSRVAKKVCKTRTGWLAQGWDPLNP